MSKTSESTATHHRPHPLVRLVATANRLVQTLAQPDLVQAVFAPGACRAFLALRHPEVGRLPATERHGRRALHGGIHAASAGRPIPLPGACNVMAFLSGCGEIAFPTLLVLGLGTRFAGIGLLFMTLIVELTVPDGWPIHITWAAMALAIMRWGPGRLSLDHLICSLVEDKG